jgi:hypothetical protein
MSDVLAINHGSFDEIEAEIRSMLFGAGLDGNAVDEICADVRARIDAVGPLSMSLPAELVNAGVLQLQTFLHQVAARYLFQIVFMSIELYVVRHGGDDVPPPPLDAIRPLLTVIEGGKDKAPRGGNAR